ncbi:Methyltransferase type 11 [Macrophomina phaseolina MS6]|uniref:Methyltransferase type 11 n=1 Tax=Macrophomina phaseolina (strain MS6) TaxID=1126212 RepID=K2S6S0_MACPH|nr:Methyltransferase type 11 [Macrophomina phaseolina MS6]
MGTGTGKWALDLADEFPDATVVGVDLSPIQPTWVPPNTQFYIDDLESDWVYDDEDDKFDFIHGRGLAGSIGDWAKLYAQAYANLKPGGWIEVQEYEGRLASDDGSLERAPFLKRWEAVMDEASSKFGKRFDVAEQQKRFLEDAGFVDVRDDVYKVPIGTWPKDLKLKELGRFQREQMVLCVEPFTLALLTRVLCWSNVETQALMNGVQKELRDSSLHNYSRFHFVYGKRPEVGQ